jgi:peptidoglycan hydrolase-like protein with peptidoglycan-binding domain
MGPNDDGQAVLKAINGLRRQQGLPLFDEMNQDVADYVDIALDQYRERRANVIRAQMALDALGYDAGPVDGLLGPRTTSAIKRYQERMGLPVTGALTDEQIDALEVRSFDRAVRRQPRG